MYMRQELFDELNQILGKLRLDAARRQHADELSERCISLSATSRQMLQYERGLESDIRRYEQLVDIEDRKIAACIQRLRDACTQAEEGREDVRMET